MRMTKMSTLDVFLSYSPVRIFSPSASADGVTVILLQFYGMFYVIFVNMLTGPPSSPIMCAEKIISYFKSFSVVFMV